GWVGGAGGKNRRRRPGAGRRGVSTPPCVWLWSRLGQMTVPFTPPLESSRASSAALPGIGEDEPTMTWRKPPSSWAMAPINSSVRVAGAVIRLLAPDLAPTNFAAIDQTRLPSAPPPPTP